MSDITNIRYILDGRRFDFNQHDLASANRDTLGEIQQAVNAIAQQVFGAEEQEDGDDSAVPEFTKIECSETAFVFTSADNRNKITIRFNDQGNIASCAVVKDGTDLDDPNDADLADPSSTIRQKVKDVAIACLGNRRSAPSSSESDNVSPPQQQHNVGPGQTYTIPAGSGGTVVVNCGGGCCHGGGNSSEFTNYLLQQILDLMRRMIERLGERRRPHHDDQSELLHVFQQGNEQVQQFNQFMASREQPADHDSVDGSVEE